MLIEQPRATTRHRVPKWFWVAGAVFFGGIAAGIVVLAIHWPFTQDAITKALEEASGRIVQIRTFSNSYFPPGCVQANTARRRNRLTEQIAGIDQFDPGRNRGPAEAGACHCRSRFPPPRPSCLR